MKKIKVLNDKIWAGPEAYRYVYSDKNPADIIINIAPKGTAKSVTNDQFILQGFEKEKWNADIMYLRDQENGHRTGAYSSIESIIEKYDLKGYDMKWGSSDHYIVKNNVEILLWGFDKGINKIMGYQKKLAWITYDELLKAEDAGKSDKYKANRANTQLKAFSSLRRNLVKGGKLVANANMHYVDPVWGNALYKFFDAKAIRKEVEKKGFFFRILTGWKDEDGKEIFPNGVAYFIANPSINQFLDPSIASLPYVGEKESAAMTESLPDESLFKEFPFKSLIRNNVEYIDYEKALWHNMEFMSVGFDPASGKDKIAAIFFGYDIKKKQIIILDSLFEETSGKNTMELMKTLRKFWVDFEKEFLYYWSEKFSEDAFGFYADTNQKTEGIRALIKIINKQMQTPKNERIISLDQEEFLGLYATAKKNGEWDHTGSINKIEELLLIPNKIAMIKTPNNLKLIHEIMNVRVQLLDEDTEPKYKIVSHGDLFDAFKYGIQHFFNTDYPTLVQELWLLPK